MRKLLTALLVIASATTAQAKVALWENTDAWQIVGDAQRGWCTASSSYANGYYLHIAKNKEGWNFSVSGTGAVVGEVYSTILATKFAQGTLQGVTVLPGQVVFGHIDRSTLANLALAPKIYIQGLGVFPLAGSAAAIKSVNACYNAISGVEL